MFCKNCGQVIDDNVKFCKNCGALVESQTNITDNAGSSAPTKPKKKSWILIAIIAIVAIIIFIPSDSGGGTSSCEKTALRFMEAMYDADASECVDLLTDEMIADMGCQTRKIAENEFQSALDMIVEEYKDKYGSSWKVDVEIVDSYVYDGYTYFPYDEVICVVLEATHKGSGLFNEKEGNETLTLINKAVSCVTRLRRCDHNCKGEER